MVFGWIAAASRGVWERTKKAVGGRGFDVVAFCAGGTSDRLVIVEFLGKEFDFMDALNDGNSPEQGASSKIDAERFRKAFQTRVVFPYRYNIEDLYDNDGYQISGDAGFGCMIRVMQMMVGEAVRRVDHSIFVKKQNSKKQMEEDMSDVEDEIDEEDFVSLFYDRPTAPFSIHNFCKVGNEKLSKPPGTWFGPTSSAQVAAKLINKCPVDLDLRSVCFSDGPVYEDVLRSMFTSSRAAGDNVVVGSNLPQSNLESMYTAGANSSGPSLAERKQSLKARARGEGSTVTPIEHHQAPGSSSGSYNYNNDNFSNSTTAAGSSNDYNNIDAGEDDQDPYFGSEDEAAEQDALGIDYTRYTTMQQKALQRNRKHVTADLGYGYADYDGNYYAQQVEILRQQGKNISSNRHNYGRPHHRPVGFEGEASGAAPSSSSSSKQKQKAPTSAAPASNSTSSPKNKSADMSHASGTPAVQRQQRKRHTHVLFWVCRQLGYDESNKQLQYQSALSALFRLPEFIGIGSGNEGASAHWFTGCVFSTDPQQNTTEQLLYFDPHCIVLDALQKTTQANGSDTVPDYTDMERRADLSGKCCGSLGFDQINSSLCLGFLVGSWEHWKVLKSRLAKIENGLDLIEVMPTKPKPHSGSMSTGKEHGADDDWLVA
ncbi:unnamed protein product [Amoebophrya sp. A120]|nr:unnamed protein product [Amoebophrya sp. A120]|eukprot:GSA120T00007235001.1